MKFIYFAHALDREGTPMKRAARRAISPIVASLLLIMIAVAAGVLIWVWVHAFVSSTAVGTPIVAERIKIEGVKYSSPRMVVYVRNIGDVNVTITAVYIEDAYTGNVVYSDTTLSVAVAPREVAEITLTLSAPLKGGRAYIVKAVTEHGIEALYQFSVP
ncbi:MAG: hypothetical protein DRO39_03620 [Thermoprotei archaeon]|nr:MAG: hypothetical protein DRO39_03620 [Thermoprotei archaeon]